MNENIWISIETSLNFVPKGPINNIPSLVQIMAWRRPGDKPISEPMMDSLLTHTSLGLNGLTAITMMELRSNFELTRSDTAPSLQWRHNEWDGVSNHRRLDSLLKRLFRRSWKKTPKLRVTGLYEGKPSVTGEFPTKRGSKEENVSIWWRHHIMGELWGVLWVCWK